MHVLMDAIEPRTCRDLGFNLRANVQTVGRVLKSYNAEQVRVSNMTYTSIGTAVQYSASVCISRYKIVGGFAVY